MNTSKKVILFIILVLLLAGCKAESPTTASSDNSSSSTTTTTNDDGTGTGTTSYVGEWVKSADNSIAIDWKSNSFVYGCLVSTYTYAAQGSYSTSNTRLTWWDGTYNTVTSSGSNILLDSYTYEPAVLYSSCNPFWTNSTSENTSYTNLAKSIGYWKFVFTYGSNYTEYILMSAISSAKNTTDYNYINVGTDSNGNVVGGSYLSSSAVYDILDTSHSDYNDYYTFTLNSTYTGISSGCYYYYNKSNSTFSSCSSLSATKLYGTPRAYRINSEIDEDAIALQKKRYMQKIMSQENNKLSEQDLAAFKRYKQLLQLQNTIEKPPLKKYLRSLRNN